MTDRYAVLGNPVAHSQSPFIHAEFARQTGEDIDYGRVLAPLDGFEATLRQFVAEGGRGCNVTVPFKLQAPKLAQRVTERAALAEAANVLRFDADGWHADNTDGIGLMRDIEAGAGVSLRHRRVLLVGAGGAGAGVLGPLLAARPEEVVLANRTLGKATAMFHRHMRWADRHGAKLVPAALGAPGLRFDVVINATSTSLQGGEPPVPAYVIRPGTLVVDLMYGPAAQPFLDWARGHGAVVRDGLGMLVEQAAEAFFFWRGVRPQTAPVLAALREKLAAAAA